MPAIIWRIGARLLPWLCLSNTPHSAGDNVSALIAEMTIETVMTTANWRKSSPDIPGIKATGTKKY
jgi:hypothetical protein